MENENSYKLFVYGSLRSGFKSDAYNYVSKYFNLLCNAKAKGILYDMGNYPVAVGTAENKFIVGELYEIKEPAAFDFIIAQLDDYEGLNGEADEISLYERKLIEVDANGSNEKAWVYWYCGNDIHNKPQVASGDVLEYFIQKNNR